MTVEKWQYRGMLRILLGVGMLLALASPACAAKFVIIAHKEVPANSLTKSELQAIFLGEKVKWEGGTHYIKIVVPEDEAIYKEFLQSILAKTPSQFDNHWLKLVYSGRGMLPQTFSDMSKLVEYVAKQKGAISFVAAGQAVGSVKTISIK